MEHNHGVHEHLLRTLPKSDIRYDTNKKAKFGLVNIRSLCNKVGPFLHHVLTEDLEFRLVTETWIKKNNDTAGYMFKNIPSKNRPGGGLGIFHKSQVKANIKCKGEKT